MDLCFKSMFSLMVRAPLSLSRLGDRDGPVGIQWGYRSYLATTNGQLTNFQCAPLTHKQTSTTFYVQWNVHGSLGPIVFQKNNARTGLFYPCIVLCLPFSGLGNMSLETYNTIDYLVAHPTARKWVITPVISGLTLLIPFIYNWGYNPLTKWDEPPSIYIYIPIGSMVLVYMLTWLGYIDGIHVTIYSIYYGNPMGYRFVQTFNDATPNSAKPNFQKKTSHGINKQIMANRHHGLSAFDKYVYIYTYSYINKK